MREKNEQSYNELSIRDLCTERSGVCEIVVFNLDEKFTKMVSRITGMKRSRIFNKLWLKYGENVRSEKVTMEIIYDNIWLGICEELKSVNQQFLDGEMQLEKLDEYLDMFKMDYDALEKEFILLSSCFRDTTTNLDHVKEKLGTRIKQVKNYKKLFDARQAAETILGLQKRLGLEGDFSEVEKIEKVSIFCCTTAFARKIFGLFKL